MRALLLNLAAVIMAGSVAALPARAEVIQKSDAGFISGGEVDVPGKTLMEVWQALIVPANWWNPLHSWSGDAANLYLDPQAGGCFCELLPKPKDAPADLRRGSIEHMRVLAAMPPRLLRLTGALGPLQGEALAGTLTVTLKPMADAGPKGGTHLTWSYVVGGYMRMKVEEIAPVVDRVMTEQFARLGAFVPAASAPAPVGAATDDVHH